MKKLRIIAGILAASLLTASLSSCGIITINHYPEDTSGETADLPEGYNKIVRDYSGQQEEYLDQIGDHDFEADTFVILAENDSMISSEDAPEWASKEVEERNEKISERYNILISPQTSMETGFYSQVMQSYESGTMDDLCGMIEASQEMLGTLTVSGVIRNLADNEYIDFDADYLDQTAIDAVSGRTYIYGVAGEGTEDPENTPVMYFNTDLIKEYGLDDPYEEYRNGTWTWEKFLEYCAEVAVIDTDETVVYTYGTQNMSTVMDDVIFVSMGNSFINSGYGDAVSLAYDNDTITYPVSVMQTMADDAYANFNSISALSSFCDGNTLFLIDRLSEMETLANGAANWGVLPLPKGSEEQEEYRSLLPSSSTYMAAVINNKSDEEIGTVISAINAASYGSLKDAFVNYSMYYYLRDNESINMLEDVLYTGIYDMSYTYGSQSNAVANATYYTVKNVVDKTGSFDTYMGWWLAGFNTFMDRIYPAPQEEETAEETGNESN